MHTSGHVSVAIAIVPQIVRAFRVYVAIAFQIYIRVVPHAGGDAREHNKRQKGKGEKKEVKMTTSRGGKRHLKMVGRRGRRDKELTNCLSL